MPAVAPIAVLGGSFDPITRAHVSILEQAAAALGAVDAWLLPTRRQPLRTTEYADVRSRLAMVHAAARERERITVVEDEALREGPSYTIDTLDAIERRHPGRDVWWILGADAARGVPAWYRVPELLSRGRFAIVNRRGVAPLSGPEAMRLGFHPGRTRMLTVDSPLISSTEVRARVARGEPVTDLVGADVASVIVELGLYRVTTP